MILAAGTLQTPLGTAPVNGCGFSYSITAVDAVLLDHATEMDRESMV